MNNPFYDQALRAYRIHERRKDAHQNLRRQVDSAFSKTTQDSIWSDIDEKASEIQNVIQQKTNELNNDIVELCLPTSAYDEASTLLAGVPTSWSSRIEEKFRQKRELYQDLINSKSDFNNVYNTNYNQIYIPTFQSLANTLEKLIPRSKDNMRDLDFFRTILGNANNALITCAITCTDYLSELNNYKQSAQNILSGLNAMLGQANGINWSKEDYCGSGAGTQSFLASELEGLLKMEDVE